MPRAAVLGSPVAHSLSPVLHRAAYASLGLAGWRYDAVECREADLPGLVDGLGPEWAGLSLTMPLKRVALDVAREVSPLAAAVGAANTLLLPGRGADNTDVQGVRGALAEAGLTSLRSGSSVLLGAGGTAAAALAALRVLGEDRPTVLVRDRGRAAELQAAAARLDVDLRLADWDALAAVSGLVVAADLVVSTVPAGAADGLAGLPWRTGTVLLDVLYAPWPTALAVGAAAAGVRVVGGFPLLLHQAAAQVRLMTELPAPVEAMRAAGEAALAARGG